MLLAINVEFDLTSVPIVHSVALTGPAVFQFTAPSSPSRHREALSIFLGVSSATDPAVARIRDGDLGQHLYEVIAKFLDNLNVPRGLKAVGYTEKDVDRLVEGTLPQRRVLDLAPGIGTFYISYKLSFCTQLIGDNSVYYTCAGLGDVAGESGAEHLKSIITNSLSY
jgi:hydroxyacid-oxoacid transhydrogenase